MEVTMNSNSLEPEVEDCVNRIEAGIEQLYLEWYFNPQRDILRNDFTYRIELDHKGEDKKPRVRLRSGSLTNRKTVILGGENAIKALLVIREKLCDNALMDLQRILSSGEFPFWFYKESEFLPPYDPVEIMKMILVQCKEIKPDSVASLMDIENLSGFFVEEYPDTKISYQRFETSINLLNVVDLKESIRQALAIILPIESTSSFSISRLLGRLCKGQFTSRPYHFYVDMGWKDTKYLLRFVNIAGFPSTRASNPRNGIRHPQHKGIFM
jgi:hypothetical protein